MPVETQHPEYINLRPVWRMMRDVCAGQRAIHAAAKAYLPALEKEPDASYKARLQRSTFFNATWRTVEGLNGMIFRIPPAVDIAAGAEAFLEDVNKEGVPFDTFAAKVTLEVLQVGRVGVLVDYPETSGEPVTVAQAEAMNLRPQLVLYAAESIINWKTAQINNRLELSLVVLSEVASIPGKDAYEHATEPRWRVLQLVPGEGGMVYQCSVYRKAANGTDELVGPPKIPLLNGAPLRQIPFQFINPTDLTPQAEDPPLLDLAFVNLSHYRSTSDRKHGAHLTALPQPWANNIKPEFNAQGVQEQQEYAMGGTELWVFPGDTTVGMLEYTGQGLQTLKEEIEREEAQMAVLGARMLEQQKKAVETAEAAGIHRAGEQSALAQAANVISRGLQNCLQIFQMWAGAGDSLVSVQLNTDFFPAQLSPQALTALVSAWQQGALSKQELFENLQAGGVIGQSVTFEDHEAQIETAPPTLAGGAGTAPGAAGG